MHRTPWLLPHLLPVLLLIMACQEKASLTGRSLCRQPSGPADTASLQVTLQPDGTIQGSGSITGAGLYLEFTRGTWKEIGTSVEAALVFTGKSYGPEGEHMLEEKRSLTVDHQALRNYQGNCLTVNF
ncbi:MAG: hypothetical protein HS115_15550 [Spirochaetales bacterium]|nr:hypothetical protein [Spirochaetales bacterium]